MIEMLLSWSRDTRKFQKKSLVMYTVSWAASAKTVLYVTSDAYVVNMSHHEASFLIVDYLNTDVLEGVVAQIPMSIE